MFTSQTARGEELDAQNSSVGFVPSSESRMVLYSPDVGLLYSYLLGTQLCEIAAASAGLLWLGVEGEFGL